MNHFEKCQSRFENAEQYWTDHYDEIIDFSVIEKLIEVSAILDSQRKAHVFCQRALRDLTGSISSVDGRLGEGTIDAINFAVRSGLAKQLKMTIAHYAANYIQPKISPTEYPTYLKKLFK
mgnify:CR=1 FL=1